MLAQCRALFLSGCVRERSNIVELYLQKGRPEQMDGRLEKEQRCYEFLDGLGVEYDRVDHAPAETMEACQAIESVLGAPICKNLFLCNRQQTQFHLLLMPGDKPFRTKEFSKEIETSRLSFATAEHMEQYLDITPGSVSIFGLMNDKDKVVHLAVDKDLLQQEFFGCHPCINTSSLRLKTEDVFGPILKALDHTMTVVELTGEE